MSSKNSDIIASIPKMRITFDILDARLQQQTIKLNVLHMIYSVSDDRLITYQLTQE